ncbi:spore germination protein [Neobacillus pocheonensis]|uniref:spore germination protein n=1 Tax=Neobacillus pocheonensis TaxID=363869 RepID=UPI003D28641B
MGFDRDKIDIGEITGGVVNFNGALVISPKSASKSALGAGAGNTAVFSFTSTAASATNTIDFDVIDQPVNGNI